MREAKDLLVACMPFKVHLHNVYIDVVHGDREFKRPFSRP